jgi:hypothetical protein
MFRYIDDVLSQSNSKFGDFVDHIYPIELEIKDTNRSASYLVLRLEIDSGSLYQGNHDRNHKLCNIGSTEIYTLYSDAAGMMLQINRKSTMGNLRSSLLS